MRLQVYSLFSQPHRRGADDFKLNLAHSHRSARRIKQKLANMFIEDSVSFKTNIKLTRLKNNVLELFDEGRAGQDRTGTIISDAGCA